MSFGERGQRKNSGNDVCQLAHDARIRLMVLAA
jgi:hypothetical protein